MRARYPDREGYVERDGVKTFYEVFGDGEPTILLLPPWSILHSRLWKMQVPYLARHYRVVTFDGRGNGRSDRPAGAPAYVAAEFAADALAVMDATGTERAVVVSLSRGAAYSLRLNAAAPDRVAAQVFVCPTTPLSPFAAARMPYARRFEEDLDSDEGWAKENAVLLAAGLPRVPGVLLLAGVPRAALHQADRGRRRLGPRHHGRDARRHEAGSPARGHRRHPGPHRPGAVPVPRHPGHRGRHRRPRGRPPARRRPRRAGPARALGGIRPLAQCPRPGEGQPPHPGVRRLARSLPPRRRPSRAAGRGARAGRAGPCTSRRRSASATPGATSPSPTSCASSTPTSRSTGWRSTR